MIEFIQTNLFSAFNTNISNNSLNNSNINNNLFKNNSIVAIKNSNNITTIKQMDITKGVILAYLGKGSYGKVNLMKVDNSIYAVKAISKKMILKKKMLLEYLNSEKKCMDGLLSPYIVTLKNTYKDKEFCYFILARINFIKSFSSIFPNNY